MYSICESVRRSLLLGVIALTLIGTAAWANAAEAVRVEGELNVAAPRYVLPQRTAAIQSQPVEIYPARPVAEVLGRSNALARVDNGVRPMSNSTAVLRRVQHVSEVFGRAAASQYRE